MMQGLPDKLIVFTDFSEPSRHAVQVSVELAKRLKRPLDVFHVLTAPPIPSMAGVAMRNELMESAKAEADQTLSSQLKRLEEVHKGTVVKSSVIARLGFEEAVERTAEASPNCLLIFGKKKRSALERVFVGSGLTNLLRRGQVGVPLLLISPDSGPLRISKLLLALNLNSPADESGFDLVEALLELFEARWDLVYASGRKLTDDELEKSLISSLPASLLAKLATINLLDSKEELSDRPAVPGHWVVAFPRRKSMLESLLKGSFSQFLADTQDCNLLLIPEQ
jgi:nucleotide-binding universal stress UspA family protein